MQPNPLRNSKTEIEIERKFYCSVTPDFKPDRSNGITQWYLNLEPMVRVRVSERYPHPVLEIKHGSGLTRTETTIKLTDAALDPLIETNPPFIHKTRHHFGRWEIDQFHDRFEGLWIAEIELETVDEQWPSVLPGVAFGRELTDLSNAVLAFCSDESASFVMDDYYIEMLAP